MRVLAGIVLVAGLAGCVQPVSYAPPPVAPLQSAQIEGVLPIEQAAENFVAVVARMEPIVEDYCHRLGRVPNCDFRIVIDDRPGQPANAFQTVDRQGRPLLAFSVALIADARNRDELAFILGHEAAHHISGHLGKTQDTAMAAAIMAGVLAQISGAGEEAVSAAQDIGATVGSRQYSKDFELEADALGAEMAYFAGYDPLRGAAFFDRLPDPGDEFLGTHPANARRKHVVQATVARLGG